MDSISFFASEEKKTTGLSVVHRATHNLACRKSLFHHKWNQSEPAALLFVGLSWACGGNPMRLGRYMGCRGWHRFLPFHLTSLNLQDPEDCDFSIQSGRNSVSRKIPSPCGKANCAPHPGRCLDVSPSCPCTPIRPAAPGLQLSLPFSGGSWRRSCLILQRIMD